MQYKVIDLVYHNMEALIGSKIGFPGFTQMISFYFLGLGVLLYFSKSEEGII